MWSVAMSLIVVVAVAFAWQWKGAETLPEGTRAVGVNTLAKNPHAWAGLVAVEGVVARVLATQGAFTLIDAEEFRKCGGG